MASTNSTANYKLNQWVGSDKPKMQDFNADNAKIDAAIHAHASDESLHISEASLQEILKSMPVFGSYTGTGAETRLIELGFRPAFGIVFANGKNLLSSVGSTGNMIVHCAMIADSGCTQGLVAENAGFTVINIQQVAEGRIAQLNAADVTYHYMMFR